MNFIVQLKKDKKRKFLSKNSCFCLFFAPQLQVAEKRKHNLVAFPVNIPYNIDIK